MSGIPVDIECTDREAAYVLGGLIYNESELTLEEHNGTAWASSTPHWEAATPPLQLL